jgi:hypothetical protein
MSWRERLTYWFLLWHVRRDDAVRKWAEGMKQRQGRWEKPSE